ncbi:MAG: hypothetical protein ACK52B_03080, partial [Gammaproteobacteria bacterium]
MSWVLVSWRVFCAASRSPTTAEPIERDDGLRRDGGAQAAPACIAGEGRGVDDLDDGAVGCAVPIDIEHGFDEAGARERAAEVVHVER